MDLALFDFDGTITTAGTYPGFVRFAVRPRRQLAATLISSPLLVAYRCGLVSDRAIRQVIARTFFRGEEANRLHRLGERYAESVLPRLVRPEALERIAWHQSRGDVVVVVSASLDFYLEPWCRAAGVEVICTQLESRDGRLTGRYVRGDCCGQEKARRIRERYVLDDFGTVHAYGDTDEDREMLAMAAKRYFRWKAVG